MSKQVIELRRSIKETMTAVGGTNGLSRNELLSEIRNRCAKQIEAARSDLEAIALGKLLNEIGGSKCSMPNGQGLDLFGNYSGIPMSIAIQKVRQDGRRIWERKLTHKCTISELTDWFEASPSPRKSRSTRHAGMRRLLNDIQPFAGSGDISLEEALKRKEAPE